MNYRLATEADLPQIKELCERNSVSVPLINWCFVAEDDDKIIGYVNAGVVGFIESFVTENSVAGLRLFSMIDGVLRINQVNPTIAGVINPEAGKELVKLGFEKINNPEFYVRRK